MSKTLTTDSVEHSSRRSSGSLTAHEHLASRQKYYLGIDGGGTKTHAVVTDSNYRILGEGFSGAANPLRVGLEDAASHIYQAVSDACAQAGVELRNIDSACAAIAGINHPIHYHTMKDALDDDLRLSGIVKVTHGSAEVEGALVGDASCGIISA